MKRNKKLSVVKKLKEFFIHIQEYEYSAILRDLEKTLLKNIDENDVIYSGINDINSYIYAKEITNNIKSVEKLEDFLNNTEGGVKYKIWESRSVKIDKLLDEDEDIR